MPLPQAIKLEVEPKSLSAAADEVAVELKLDPAGGWKNLCMRVVTDQYPQTPPIIAYPPALDSRSRTVMSARTSFERAITMRQSPLTLTSLAEVWISSVTESLKAYGVPT